MVSFRNYNRKCCFKIFYLLRGNLIERHSSQALIE